MACVSGDGGAHLEDTEASRCVVTLPCQEQNACQSSHRLSLRLGEIYYGRLYRLYQ